ncbi:hypothetical protein OIU84_012493 [Salix udensis]|uniref:Uncharacterized protein n=1 Tax=Salix udensis TaxID=889485 RepID=A0AAD6NTE1_9ROSI|nr:hypothetical protein OIU84_012493 [Salix udensis]
MNRTLESRKDDQQEEEDDEKALAIWDLDSSLYDSHELVSLTQLIERHLVTLPSLGGSKRVLSSKKTSQASVAVPAAILVSNMGSKSETKRLRFSSTLNTMSEFVKRKLRIKKRIRSHRRKDSSEKLRIKNRIRSHSRKDNSDKLKVGHCSSCIKFGL